jgi:hypothetical protein
MMTFAEFEQVCAGQPYQRKGMFYSEVYFFLQACDRRGVHALVESGVKFGMSTRLLGASFAGSVVAVEQNLVVTSIPGVDLIRGDSTILLPRLVKRYAPMGVGVLIDGPKGQTALQLKGACLAAGARVVGVHDQHAGGDETCHTHSSKHYGEIAKILDRFVSPEFLSKYPHGSGLAIWEKA